VGLFLFSGHHTENVYLCQWKLRSEINRWIIQLLS